MYLKSFITMLKAFRKTGDSMRGKQILIGALSALLVLTTSGTAGAKGKTKKSDNHVMTASVVFKPTSETNLTNDVYDTVDPSSTAYHQYLTPSQFAEKFGQSKLKGIGLI